MGIPFVGPPPVTLTLALAPVQTPHQRASVQPQCCQAAPTHTGRLYKRHTNVGVRTQCCQAAPRDESPKG
eukprot:366316-Chlamydomonas_euryale.AAC.3